VNIAAPFIRRPVAAILLIAGILAVGLGSFGLLPVAALPRVDFPTISVSAALPGASPETMAASVATPLEQQFAGMSGLTQMTSSSGVGVTNISLQFTLDRNIDSAAADVQAAITQASAQLPKDLPSPPVFYKTNPTDRAVLILTVASDILPVYKVDAAATLIAQRISAVPGVAEVYVAGSQPYSPRIELDPAALAARNLSLEDVRAAVSAQTQDLPKGTLEGNDQSLTLDTSDQLFDAAAFSNIIVAWRNGAPVRLCDVARVVDSVQDSRVAGFDGLRPAEFLQVYPQAGANIVHMVEQINAILPTLQAALPPSVTLRDVSDRSETIRGSIHEAEHTLLLSVLLVVTVIYVFLRQPRVTLIPSIAVPLSLAGTFGAMVLLGYGLDNLSLMALTIAVGFVVDDAIVMVENITRYIEMGLSPRAAALKGSAQIGFTIISITASLVAVFIPLLFMAGIAGRLFREFSVTVVVAVGISALIALTLTPALCALLLRPELPEAKPGIAVQWLEHGYNSLLRHYERGLVWAFRHRRGMLVSILLLVGATAWLYQAIPKGFFPDQDNGYITTTIEARPDIAFAQMVGIESRVTAIMRADPSVATVVGVIGAGGFNSTENTARVYVQLKPFKQRNITVQQYVQRMRPRLATVPGMLAYMQTSQDVTIGARVSKDAYQYTLTDNDPVELNEWATHIQGAMKHLTQLQDVTTDQEPGAPHLAVEINRDKAARYGLSSNDIDQTLYDAFGQRQVGTIYTAAMTQKVILEIDPQVQQDKYALDRIFLLGSGGKEIPLSTVASLLQRLEPLTVNHQGQYPAVTLSFNLAPGKSLSDAVTAIQAMQAGLDMPPGLKSSFQGTAQAFRDSLETMPLLIAAAILAVYIVLGVLYESFVHPLTILSSLPSAGVGALLLLMVTGYELDLISLIGIILLVGIVKKNAIMMIDFALDAERNLGMSAEQAIFQACLLRFRPIMMTTMAALLGSLPLALGVGAGAELRRPLGIAIVGGLLLSQVLTLYSTPIIYLYLDKLGGGLKAAWRSRRARAAHDYVEAGS